MRRTEVFEGSRMMKFRSVFDRWARHELGQLEAAELLGVVERTFWRSCGRYREGGENGIADRRLDQAAVNWLPADQAIEIEAPCGGQYAGCTAKHFHDHLVRDHAFAWSYTCTKVFPQSRGLEAFTAHSLPCSLYTDRGNHYFHPQIVGGKVNRLVQT